MVKRQGQHPDKALSAVRVRSLREAGRYADGGGLYLDVGATGAKAWLLRLVVQGRRRDIGLGGLSTVTLSEAREQAVAFRKTARAGGDPLSDRRKKQVPVPTFEQAARSVHEAHKAGWKNPKHAAQWLSTLVEYAFPSIGERRVDQVDTSDVLKVLAPIWLAKPETARRIRQCLRAVLDWASASGHRAGENPVNGVAKGLPKQKDKEEHRAAMPYVQVPAFVGGLPPLGTRDSAWLALEFLILTAARTGEVIGATWSEIDELGETWTIPATRMKAGREHRVPLVPRCLNILAAARPLATGGNYVFPGQARGKPLSNMAMLMAMRRRAPDYTVHGFRSSFRDWASEQTSFPNEVCEAALAHAVRDKLEAAYRIKDLFVRRRELMVAWAAYLEAESGTAADTRS